MKRFWTWTDKNKRKSRNHKRKSDMIPKRYYNAFKKSYRRHNKMIIKNRLEDEKEFKNMNRLYNEVNWTYW